MGSRLMANQLHRAALRKVHVWCDFLSVRVQAVLAARVAALLFPPFSPVDLEEAAKLQQINCQASTSMQLERVLVVLAGAGQLDNCSKYTRKKSKIDIVDPMEQHGKQGKSQRKRLQRQLEFYLSDSNLRQDKFLQHSMDDQGFVPVRVFLTFNKMKTLNATERMILDAADKSASIRTDRARSCIAPETLPAPDQDHETDLHTVYIDSVGMEDDHDSLRRTFSKFGKVNLVSLPRFQQSKRFKGFGFVEFREQSAAEEATKAARSLDPDLRGIRVMSKVRWLEMKEQLKLQLSTATTGDSKTASKEGGDKKDGTAISNKKMECNLAKGSEKTPGEKKQKRRKASAGGHIHFGDGEDGGDGDAPMQGQHEEAAETHQHQEQRAKKQKV